MNFRNALISPNTEETLHPKQKQPKEMVFVLHSIPLPSLAFFMDFFKEETHNKESNFSSFHSECYTHGPQSPVAQLPLKYMRFNIDFSVKWIKPFIMELL